MSANTKKLKTLPKAGTDKLFDYSVLNSIGIPSFVINAEHLITHWNQAIVKASGFAYDKMIGTKNQWKPFYSQPRPTLADLIVDGGQDKAIEEFYTSKYSNSKVLKNAYEAEDYFPAMGNGEWLSFTAAPITDSNGIIIGAVETLVIISDRKKAEQELIESQQKYRELSTLDDLTQLFNARHFYEQLHNEIERSNRYNQKLTICMFDLDHFKKINDNYGHQLGNEILEKFGHIIKKNIRHIDAGFRYGGEEFIVIFPLIAAENAMRVAERIRLELEQTRFVTIDKESVTATVSAGIANHLHNESQETLIRRTDKAMYSSKHNGRNRVTVSK